MLPIALTVLAFLYFTFIHSKIFKGRKIPFIAFILEALVYGMGFAYLRQPIIALISWFGMYVFVFKLIKNDDISTFLQLIILVTIFAVPFLTLAFTDKANLKSIRDRLSKESAAKTRGLISLAEQGASFAIDTNILMHEPELLVKLVREKQPTIVMCKTVFKELDGLKKSHDRNTRFKAQQAFNVIETLQQVGCIDIGYFDEFRSQFNLRGDERIIATYIALKKTKYPDLVFISNDKGARIIAREANLPVVDLKSFI